MSLGKVGGLAAMLCLVTGCDAGTTGKANADPAKASLDGALQAHGCAACHAADSTRVGPSMAAIAARYGPKAGDALLAAIKTGSDGKWGAAKMVPQSQVSEAEASNIAALVERIGPAE